MKLHELAPDLREKETQRQDDHLETLRGLQITAATEAQSMLWAANGGAAVALMAFMGSKESIRDSTSAWMSLVSFFVGIVALGLLRAMNYHTSLKLLDGWIVRITEVRKGLTGIDAPAEWLSAAINKHAWVPIALGYLSFACFVFGCVWAASHLPQLAHIENYSVE
jgi:hypothetical protein